MIGGPASQSNQFDSAALRPLIDVAPVMIWIAGPDGLCSYFNAAWLEFTGSTLDSQVGLGWLDGVHPDDRVACRENYLQAVSQNKTFSMEYRLRHSSGEFRWVLDRGVPQIDKNGNLLHYIGAVIDVAPYKLLSAQLRHSEQRYRSIVEDQTEMVCRFLPDTTLTFVNQAYCTVFGKPAGELLGKRFIDLIPDTDR